MPNDHGERTRSFLGGVLQFHRERKRQRYLAKIRRAGHQGPRIVAEGDSWFEYPFSDDLIMHLGEKYAVLGLAKAADSFDEVAAKNELLPTLLNPPEGKDIHIVLLSLGGNEVMGHIEDFVRPFEFGRPDDRYILPSFEAMVDGVRTKLAAVVQPILFNGDQHVILHGYDYPDPRFPPDLGEMPNGSQWIGPPLKHMRNIGTLPTYRCIANMMLDSFNAMMKDFAERPEHEGRVHYVNLLGTIGVKDHHRPADAAFWNDEIHGSDEGFRRLARKFEPVIDEVWLSMQQA